MNDASALLATLQHADSFFPAGGIAFSWGVETLIADGVLRGPEQLESFARGQVEHRWGCFDRAVVAAAHNAAQDIDALAAIDAEVEAMTMATEQRTGSRRAGSSLLTVHERIGTPNAAEYRAAVQDGRALGHLPVVQGAVWRGAGLTGEQAQAASAHQFCVSLLSAALRLGAIGHLQAQAVLTAMRGVLVRLLATPPLDIAQIYAFTPATEIAMMRHEVQTSRLFAN